MSSMSRCAMTSFPGLAEVLGIDEAGRLVRVEDSTQIVELRIGLREGTDALVDLDHSAR